MIVLVLSNTSNSKSGIALHALVDVPYYNFFFFSKTYLFCLNIEVIIRAKIENALKHLHYPRNILIIEDTGLYLKALNDFPGPLIKFMLNSIDNEGIFKICLCFNNYDAYAKTVFGMYHPDNKEIKYYSAIVNGFITNPKGAKGFGWDPIFIPSGTEKTFAEMTNIKEKNKFSMRFKALEKMLQNEYLQ